MEPRFNKCVVPKFVRGWETSALSRVEKVPSNPYRFDIFVFKFSGGGSPPGKVDPPEIFHTHVQKLSRACIFIWESSAHIGFSLAVFLTEKFHGTVASADWTISAKSDVDPPPGNLHKNVESVWIAQNFFNTQESFCFSTSRWTRTKHTYWTLLPVT